MTLFGEQTLPPPIPFEFHGISRGILRSMLGIRFHHRGRIPQVGFDCVGFLSYWGHRLGLSIEIPLSCSEYPEDFWLYGFDQRLLAELEKVFVVIPPRMVDHGDIVVLKIKHDQSRIGHVGIIDDPAAKTFFHCSRPAGVRHRTLHDRYFTNRVHAVMRHRQTSLLVDRRSEVPLEMKISHA